MFAEYMNTADCKSRQTEVNDYDRPFQPYAQPVHLPLLPQYDIDVPDQEGKLFGGVAATRYETASIQIHITLLFFFFFNLFKKVSNFIMLI